MSIAMAETVGFNVEYLDWDDIKASVITKNPELYQAIGEVNPSKSKKLKLLKAKYLFGDVISENGTIHLPTKDGKLVAVNSLNCPESLKEALSYSPIPLAMILTNTSEVFVTATDRIIPLNFFTEGDLFGVFETINSLMDTPSTPIWKVTAGARDLFMLPKITNTLCHNKIRKEYGVLESIPANLSDHWKIFSQIAHYVTNSWSNEVIFFTREWFDALHSNNKDWMPFYKFLFKTGWTQQQIFRDQTEFDLIWESFILAVSNRNLKPRPYLIDTTKHLALIANGSAIAFKPATDETAAPIKFLQDCYINIYGLKEYIPTIMQPCKLSAENPLAYYSLSYPTVPGTNPYLRNAPSIIEDQREVKRLIETLKDSFPAVAHGLHRSIKETNFELLHSEVDALNEIKHTKDLDKVDPRFRYIAKIGNAMDNKTFCFVSQFMRGCIAICKN